MDFLRVKKVISDLDALGGSFLIGTAASAHQVEGNNTNNDWADFELVDGNIANNDKSGMAVNHYELFDQDFQLLADLGFKAHRLSIEWSRIFPTSEEVDNQEIAHYRTVLESLHDSGQLSFVTLHHFTSPKWFIKKGGFKKKSNLIYWEEFVEVICKELGDVIDIFNTINEPFIYCATSYLQGVHAPGEKSLLSYFRVGNNLMRAHFYAVDIIRKYCPDTPVGLVKNLINFTPKPGWNPINSIISFISDFGYNKRPNYSLRKQRIPFGFSKIKRGDMGDFVGINFYIKLVVHYRFPDFMIPHDADEKRLSQMKWGVHPKAMSKEIRRLHQKLDLPIFITENGLATDDDNWRIEYILDHLEEIVKLKQDGIDIRGYFYWSFIDNFEWAEGYFPKFGLMSYNRETFERSVKPSGEVLGEIAEKVWKGKRVIEF